MNRTDLLNHLATKYNLKSYLEIGVQDPKQNFDKIVCEDKWSVDPDPKANASFIMTSDQFFTLYFIAPLSKYDLIFIDGLHHAEQVKKDFENALRVLSPNGFIVLHDCNPLKEEHTIVPRPTPTGHWNGDVYKFAVQIGNDERYVTVDIDNGCGVWHSNKTPFLIDYGDREWADFDSGRKYYLNLISWDEFVALHN